MIEHICPENKSILKAGTLYVGCDLCLSSKLQQGSAAQYNRNWQKGQYRKDILQPNQGRDFVRAYGYEKSKEAGYSDEDIRLLS